MKYDRTTTTRISSCLLVLLSFCNLMFGQDARETKAIKATVLQNTEEHPYYLCTHLVVLDIEAEDGYHWPVTDLRHLDLAVFEDGKEQPIAYFEYKKVSETGGEIPGHYRLGYYPPNIDGEFKRVRLKFRDAEKARDKGLRLKYSPNGYYASFEDSKCSCSFVLRSR